jgi:hypothetical protein
MPNNGDSGSTVFRKFPLAARVEAVVITLLKVMVGIEKSHSRAAMHTASL